MDKILSFSGVKAVCANYKAAGKKVVFTNGCFDILHAGHVKYLIKAAEFGDVLILGLNSDHSVKCIKGEKRPVIGQEHRAYLLSALFCVDHVVLFDEPDPRRLIEAVCPDILVKGADWQENEILGGDFVRQNKGKIERVDLVPDISTTRIIERIGELYYGKG